MSDRCGCDREGRYCHAGELCKNDGPCPCCAPVRGLDFEAALLTLKGAAWDFPRRIKDHLNAQLAERLAEARAEGREAHATYVNNAAVGVADEVRRQYAPLVAAWREWVEARKALKGKPVARPFADSALVKNLRDAEAALAAYPLEDTP